MHVLVLAEKDDMFSMGNLDFGCGKGQARAKCCYFEAKFGS